MLRLLREGLVAEALEAYTAPLLSRSGVLAVQLLRDQLDLAVESAVRGSGDAGLLARWLSTDMGSGDVAAVEGLGQLVVVRIRSTYRFWQRVEIKPAVHSMSRGCSCRVRRKDLRAGPGERDGPALLPEDLVCGQAIRESVLGPEPFPRYGSQGKT